MLEDEADFLALTDELRAYYEPEGAMENLQLDMITVDLLRRGRVLQYEQQKMMKSAFPFEMRSADRIQRCQTALNRQLAAAFKELERLQAQRKASAGMPGRAHTDANEQFTEAPTHKAVPESNSTADSDVFPSDDAAT